MQQVPVSSKIIKEVYFSQDDGKLHIRFKNGQERRFEGVTTEAVSALCEAKSPGQYYIDIIRTRFRRIAA